MLDLLKLLLNQLYENKQLTAKYFVDETICRSLDESSLSRLGAKEKVKFDEKDSMIFKPSLTSPETILEVPTKTYAVSLSENDKNRQDISTVFKDQDYELANINLTTLDCLTVERNPLLGEEVSNK